MTPDEKRLQELRELHRTLKTFFSLVIVAGVIALVALVVVPAVKQTMAQRNREQACIGYGGPECSGPQQP